MARKRTHNSKRIPEPLDWEKPEEEVDEAPYVPDPELKSTVFRELLRYNPRRRPSKTISEVLQICLARRVNKPTVTMQERRAFFISARVLKEKWEEACSRPWFFAIELGDYVFSVLKHAGYSGTVDDLWRSVYGMAKLAKSICATEEVGPELTRQLKVWFVNGQTRKPGSHRFE